jgi:N-acetylglucosaminyldiphosphoundecaprenol N-acetyl-beta-D-mannosaminyltransferase
VKLSPERLNLLGIPIDYLDMKSVVETILGAARERRFFQVATVNADFLVNSRRDREVRAILTEDDLNIPDGAPVVWAGKVLGRSAATRIAGADLVPALMRAAAFEGLRVFLLGGENSAAFEAAAILRARHPQLQVSAYEPPRSALDDMDNATILGSIRDVEPHILLVAFGHPKQDKWIRRNRDALPVAAIGVGCSLDLIAGRQSRAPAWMQNVGLEWAYRLANEPGRLLHRYATDGLWVAGYLFPWVLTQWISQAQR